MKNFLLATILLISLHASAQSHVSDYNISTDEKTGQIIYKGQISFADLEKEPSFTWLKKGADEYKPDSALVVYLKKHLKNYDMVVFMGTWCDDSHDIIPKLYKLLQLTDYPMNQYTMYGVDRAKQAKYIEHKLYHITNVPTIIVMKNNTEIGRITETVEVGVAADIKNIVEKDVEKSQNTQQ